MAVMQPRVSYTDLQQAPDDGRRYELYNGEVWVVPAPLPRHQRVVQKILALLTEYEQASGGLVFDSPIDIVFSEFDVVQPDVVFFEKRRRMSIDMLAPIRVAPDLAVEVLSPSTAATDRGRKMRLLARYGVLEYWLVDPNANQLEIYVLRGEAYTVEGTFSEVDEVQSALPDLHFAASRIFTE